MQTVMTIELSALRFHGYHGLYAEERLTGNEFEVDMKVAFIPPGQTITSLAETINYSAIYELVKAEMQKPRALLETLAMEITEHVHALFPFVTHIEISIKKMFPPIAQFTGQVGVRFMKEF
jgi:dihydroneopterin aldolase